MWGKDNFNEQGTGWAVQRVGFADADYGVCKLDGKVTAEADFKTLTICPERRTANAICREFATECKSQCFGTATFYRVVEVYIVDFEEGFDGQD